MLNLTLKLNSENPKRKSNLNLLSLLLHKAFSLHRRNASLVAGSVWSKLKLLL